jgi:oligopeptide/dipeptide ABC transporter ATP-binding protein
MATPGEDIETIPGEPLSVGKWPTGCRFWPRCPMAQEDCRVGPQPPLARFAHQLTACIHADQMEEKA